MVAWLETSLYQPFREEESHIYITPPFCCLPVFFFFCAGYTNPKSVKEWDLNVGSQNTPLLYYITMKIILGTYNIYKVNNFKAYSLFKEN